MKRPAATARPIIRNVYDIPSERGVCGFRRRIVTEQDTPAANISHLVIDDSKEHYHKQMTEFYYVLKGGGEMVLDGERRPIKEGDLVVIPPGVRHTSEGDMEVLIIGVPPQETEDIYFD
jgi:mannose-6-phosphate isomerase-like protein (cupin superfamily)